MGVQRMTDIMDKFKEHLSKKKYQVHIEIKGKKTFAYTDDIKIVEDMMKTSGGKILEVKKLHD